MTTVTIETGATRENRNDVRITAEGHAEYAEKGQDIVCAGISSAMDLVCKYLDGVGQLDGVETHDGFLQVRAFGFLARELVDAFAKLCEEMQEQYPENIRVRRGYF